MTTDQLLFTAARTANDAAALLERIWNGQRGAATLAQARELAGLARALNCAALELENRLSGSPGPEHVRD